MRPRIRRRAKQEALDIDRHGIVLAVVNAILDLEGIPKEVTIIMRGVIILCVVIAYEVVRRIVQAQEVRAAAERMRQLADQQEPVPA